MTIEKTALFNEITEVEELEQKTAPSAIASGVVE